jgi:putative ABC transport system ATP-binding protein
MSDDELAAVRSQHLGFVFQQFFLLEELTAEENVALALVYRGLPPGIRLERARAVLDRVGIGHRSHHLPKEMSGGERQRVAIARALVTEPALLLADEPTGNLDSASTGAILDLIERLHAEGVTVVIITHDLGVAARAPRTVTVSDGRIEGDTADAMSGSTTRSSAASAVSAGARA